MTMILSAPPKASICGAMARTPLTVRSIVSSSLYAGTITTRENGEIEASTINMMPSRFVLGDEVTRLDKHIGLGSQRNGVIAALGRRDRFQDCQPCERAAQAQPQHRHTRRRDIAKI